VFERSSSRPTYAPEPGQSPIRHMGVRVESACQKQLQLEIPHLVFIARASARYEVVRERRVGETEPQEEMPGGTLGCPAPGPVTSFLFIRYRLQSFKVGAEVPNPRME